MSRLRRWLRAFYLVCVWGLAILAVAWLGARLWALHVVRTAVPDFEAKHGSLDRSQWERKMPPPSENAGPYLRAAVLLFDRSGPEWERWQVAMGKVHGDQPAPIAPEDLDGIVARNRDALDLLHKAATMPQCVLSEGIPSPTSESPGWVSILGLARVERELERSELRSGDEAAAVGRIETILVTDGCLANEPTLVVHLLGVAIDRMALRDLHDALAAGRFDAALDTLQDRLHRRATPSTADLIRWEAAVFQPNAWRQGDPRSRGGTSAWNPFVVDGFMGAASVQALGATLERLEDPTPPPGWNPAWFFPWQMDRYMRSIDRTYWFYDRTEKAQAAVRALARAALAVRSRGLASGTYPESLEAVDPSLLQPTPLVSERIQYTREVDGSVRLALPGTKTESKRVEALSVHPRHFDFVWTLPPLTDSHGSVPPVE